MKRICIYGKGGIGKSTVAANLAAALAESGLSAAVIGCDPKADSTRSLMGYKIPAVLDLLRAEKGGQIAFSGYNNVLCIESGGPEPGSGCAGRGIIAAIREMQNHDVLNGRDIVIYDVLGDVVCGGFSMPLREEVADQVYLVTTADFMSLYAANNICRGVRKYAQSGNVRLAGVIYNGRSSTDNMKIVEAFAEKVGTELAGMLPMSKKISLAELERKTVLENFPDDEASECFRHLSKYVFEREGGCIPHPLSDEEVEDLCRQA